MLIAHAPTCIQSGAARSHQAPSGDSTCAQYTVVSACDTHLAVMRSVPSAAADPKGALCPWAAAL